MKATDGSRPARAPAPGLEGTGATRARLAAGALLASLAASVGLPFACAGRAGWWALPAGTAWVPCLVRAAVVTAAVAAAAYAFAALLAVPRRRALRAAGTAAVLLALAGVFRAAATEAPIGDWPVVQRAAADLVPLGKWLLASLAYGAFHRVAGLPLGLEPLESVRWLSSLAGAASVLLFADIARRLALPAVLRAWPFLYAGAYGAVGVGLGHAEIYALVGALLLAILDAGLALLAAPSPARAALVGALVGTGLATYVGFVLVVVPWLGLVAWLAAAGRPAPRAARAAAPALALLLPLLIAPLAIAAFPAEAPLQHHWARQFGGGAALNARAEPAFLPPDVHWGLLTNFVAPRYWLAAWHLRDLVQLGWLGDRAGLLLIAALAAPAAVAAWRRRGGAALAFLAAACAIYLGYAALVVHGIPYPWDWDLTSPAFFTTPPLAAALLAGAAAGRRWPAVVEGLLVASALAAQVAGAAFVARCATPPAAFGAPVDGLRVGVDPAALALTRGEPVDVMVWLRNDGPAPVTWRRQPSVHGLLAADGERRLRSRQLREATLVERTLAPGATTWLTRVEYVPDRLDVSEPGAPDWRRGDALAPPGVYEGRWMVRLVLAGRDQPVDLASAPLEIRILPGGRAR